MVGQMRPRIGQYALRGGGGEGRKVDGRVRVRGGAAACYGSVSGLPMLSMRNHGFVALQICRNICRCFMNSVESKHHLGAK